MTIDSLERKIVAELKAFTGNKKIKLEHLMEWSSAPIAAQAGERLVKLPSGFHVCYKEPK